MDNLIIALRAGQLFTHAAHNLVTGPSFFGDHGFFGDSYEAFEGAYDDVVEQEIARGNTPNLPRLNMKAAAFADAYETGKGADELFGAQESLEEYLREAISKEVKDADDAGQSLLQKIAEDSLKRTYKIQARLGK